ncbi:hypothetical protein D3C81_1871270 [compost metagenome]
MSVADIDLRHGTTTGFFHHRHALGRIKVDPDFFDIGDTLGRQQALCHCAIRADAGAIHHYMRSHKYPFYFVTGRPCDCQASSPPSKLVASVKPSFFKSAVALFDCKPLLQTTITGRALNFSNSATRPFNSFNGMFFASRMWPAA